VGRVPSDPRPIVDVVAAAIVDDLDAPTRLLAARRTEPPALAGGWELPGGKVDPGETAVEALHREIREELGVSVRLGAILAAPTADGRWSLGDGYRMTVWLAVVSGGDPQPIEWSHGETGRGPGLSTPHDALRWLPTEDLYAVGWLPADLPIARALRSRMVRGSAKP
jgi:8-oxo-dGTP diphosphatase